MNNWPKVKKEGWMTDILLNDKSEKFLSKYLHRRFKLIDKEYNEETIEIISTLGTMYQISKSNVIQDFFYNNTHF